MAQLRAVSPNDPLSQRALDGFEMGAPILQDLEFHIVGTDAARQKRRTAAAAGTNLFRSLNESMAITGGSRNYDLVPKRIVSVDAAVDMAIEDRNEEPEDELVNQVYEEAMVKGYAFQAAVFKADTATNGEAFYGFEALCDDFSLVDTPASAIIVPAGSSDAVTAQQMLALENLQTFFAVSRATHAYMSFALRSRLLHAARNCGYYHSTHNDLGEVIERIGDTIIRAAGFSGEGDDTEILPMTETLGAHEKTGSIYAVRHLERAAVNCPTSAGLKVRSVSNGVMLEARGTLDMAIALQDRKALRRYKGWAIEEAEEA